MLAGDVLRSPNGEYKCTYREDGNLVVTETKSGAAIWESQTAGNGSGRVTQKVMATSS